MKSLKEIWFFIKSFEIIFFLPAIFMNRIKNFYKFREEKKEIFSNSSFHILKLNKIFTELQKNNELLLRKKEAFQLYNAVRIIKTIPGDLAEVGVYKGGSAKIICEAKGKKPLHLFDTFSGLPEVGYLDSFKFFKGEFAAPINIVRNKLRNYKNIHFYQGFFPDTSKPVKDKKFSFIHIDVDTYRSTLNCLKFFYPRMNKGAILLSHDYMFSLGVRKAFKDFFKDKQEKVIELPGTQCMFIKS